MTTIPGTPGDDVLFGTGADETLIGLGGGDGLLGAGGNDVYVYALGNGNDVIIDTGGIDTLDLNALSTLAGGFRDGYDAVLTMSDGGTVRIDSHYTTNMLELVTFLGSGSLNLLTGTSGGPGDDILLGDTTDDLLDGFDGDDRLFAGGGNDTLLNGIGNDTLHGDVGNDYYDFSSLNGANTIFDSGGTDTLSMTFLDDIVDSHRDGDDAVLSLSFGGSARIVGQFGGNAVETVTDGIVGPKSLVFGTGGVGDEIVLGTTGSDTLDGGAGFDIVFGGAGGDTLSGGADDDTLRGGIGDDTFLVGLGSFGNISRAQVIGLDAVFELTDGSTATVAGQFDGASSTYIELISDGS